MNLRDKFRRGSQKIVEVTTRSILLLGLFVIYFTILPLTGMALGVSKRLRGRPRHRSYWVPSEGYHPSLEDSFRQS